jgi:ABC-type amino acid transport substrate-binding protein
MKPALKKNSFVIFQKFGVEAKKTILTLFLTSIILIGCTGQTINSTLAPNKQPADGNNTDSLHSSLDQIQERGILIVGTAITKPFEFYDSDTGNLSGFDIDLINFIGKQIGVDIEYVEMSFANLIPALQDGKVDMTIAAMYITEEREKLVDFSAPYLDSGLVMVAHPGLQKQIKRVEDLAGLKVGVKIGSTGAELAQALVTKGYNLKITEYKDTFDSFLDLEVERVDVILNDYLNSLAYIKNSQSNLKIIIDDNGEVIYLSNVGLGIAVQQGNQELLNIVNVSLMKMNQTGEITRIYETWLMPNGN